MIPPTIHRPLMKPARRMDNLTPNFVQMRARAKMVQMERIQGATPPPQAHLSKDAMVKLRQLEALLCPAD